MNGGNAAVTGSHLSMPNKEQAVAAPAVSAVLAQFTNDPPTVKGGLYRSSRSNELISVAIIALGITDKEYLSER